MYKTLGWLFLIGIFMFVLCAGLISAQTTERFVPAFESKDGKVLSIDLDSIIRGEEDEKDFVSFKARIATDQSNHLTSAIIANCKDKQYAFLFHDKVENGNASTEVPKSLVKIQSKKGTIMWQLITKICTATEPKILAP